MIQPGANTHAQWLTTVGSGATVHLFDIAPEQPCEHSEAQRLVAERDRHPDSNEGERVGAVRRKLLGVRLITRAALPEATGGESVSRDEATASTVHPVWRKGVWRSEVHGTPGRLRQGLGHGQRLGSSSQGWLGIYRDQGEKGLSFAIISPLREWRYAQGESIPKAPTCNSFSSSSCTSLANSSRSCRISRPGGRSRARYSLGSPSCPLAHVSGQGRIRPLDRRSRVSVCALRSLSAGTRAS